MSEASNPTPTAADNGEERRDSVASAKSAASVYSTEPEKASSESIKDEVRCVSLPSFPSSYPSSLKFAQT